MVPAFPAGLRPGKRVKKRQAAFAGCRAPIGAMAGGVFCGSTCDWKLPQRYFGERKEYNELMSAEISMGSTATTHGPSWTTYDTMHAGQPHFNFTP